MKDTSHKHKIVTVADRNARVGDADPYGMWFFHRGGNYAERLNIDAKKFPILPDIEMLEDVGKRIVLLSSMDPSRTGLSASLDLAARVLQDIANISEEDQPSLRRLDAYTIIISNIFDAREKTERNLMTIFELFDTDFRTAAPDKFSHGLFHYQNNILLLKQNVEIANTQPEFMAKVRELIDSGEFRSERLAFHESQVREEWRGANLEHLDPKFAADCVLITLKSLSNATDSEWAKAVESHTALYSIYEEIFGKPEKMHRKETPFMSKVITNYILSQLTDTEGNVSYDFFGPAFILAVTELSSNSNLLKWAAPKVNLFLKDIKFNPEDAIKVMEFLKENSEHDAALTAFFRIFKGNDFKDIEKYFFCHKFLSGKELKTIETAVTAGMDPKLIFEAYASGDEPTAEVSYAFKIFTHQDKDGFPFKEAVLLHKHKDNLSPESWAQASELIDSCFASCQTSKQTNEDGTFEEKTKEDKARDRKTLKSAKQELKNLIAALGLK